MEYSDDENIIFLEKYVVCKNCSNKICLAQEVKFILEVRKGGRPYFVWKKHQDCSIQLIAKNRINHRHGPFRSQYWACVNCNSNLTEFTDTDIVRFYHSKNHFILNPAYIKFEMRQFG